MTHEVELFFGNEDSWENLGKFKDEQEMLKVARRKLREMNFKWYYFKHWLDGNGFTYIDYGAESTFFRYKYCNVRI